MEVDAILDVVSVDVDRRTVPHDPGPGARGCCILGARGGEVDLPIVLIRHRCPGLRLLEVRSWSGQQHIPDLLCIEVKSTASVYGLTPDGLELRQHGTVCGEHLAVGVSSRLLKEFPLLFPAPRPDKIVDLSTKP